MVTNAELEAYERHLYVGNAACFYDPKLLAGESIVGLLLIRVLILMRDSRVTFDVLKLVSILFFLSI